MLFYLIFESKYLMIHSSKDAGYVVALNYPDIINMDISKFKRKKDKLESIYVKNLRKGEFQRNNCH